MMVFELPLRSHIVVFLVVEEVYIAFRCVWLVVDKTSCRRRGRDEAQGWRGGAVEGGQW